MVPGNGWRRSGAGDRRQCSSDLGEGQVVPGNGYKLSCGESETGRTCVESVAQEPVGLRTEAS